ncbi:MAG TPA: exodeoxyribonuclease III [Solirubrobacteraceae bacterium]|nr:exodeoxyribonuclease III [Solirubrobacteraceae bacterium]
MLVVTWNVNSLRARLPRVLEFLERHRPDVLCLQETKVSGEQFPVAELAAAGYAAEHHSGGQWSGVAILARDGLALEAASCGLPGDPMAGEARWCEATVAGIRFASTYVPNGRSLDSPEFPRKLAFLDAAVARVREAERPFVLVGDFNIAPDDLDVYAPELFAGATHVTREERMRLAEMLEAGMVDSYRALHPGEQQFTWWDYRAGNFHKGLGLRIDLALVSSDLRERLVSCRIDRNFRKGKKPSDHAPLLVELS